jgi:O-antigen/teichoic acid export membrane protein
LLLVGIIKFIESLFDIVHADFQKKEFMQFMSVSIILQSLLSLLIFAITLFLTNSLVNSLISIIVVLITILCVYDLRIFLKINNINILYIQFIQRHFYKKNNLIFVKKLLANALPLGVSVFVGSYLTNLPRIYVEKYLGLEQLAYFGAMSYMAIGFFQLLLPIQIILRSRLAKLLKQHKWNEFIKYLNVSIFSTIIFGSILISTFYLIGDYVLIKVYNENYTSYLNILLLLMLGQIILTSSGYLNIAVQTFYIFKLQLLVSIFLLFIVFLIGPVLIKTFNINGAAYLIILYAVLSFLFYITIFIWKKPC